MPPVDVAIVGCGPAGALLANLTGLASPNLLQWTQSGTLLVMVIIGGVGYLYGGLVGALVLLCLEEVLAGFTWPLGMPLASDDCEAISVTPDR